VDFPVSDLSPVRSESELPLDITSLPHQPSFHVNRQLLSKSDGILHPTATSLGPIASIWRVRSLPSRPDGVATINFTNTLCEGDKEMALGTPRHSRPFTIYQNLLVSNKMTNTRLPSPWTSHHSTTHSTAPEKNIQVLTSVLRQPE
jgi:hypothetical protein